MRTPYPIVIHAHCYQPPREDPWLELIPRERSASPDHNWNARIDRECYARLAAAPVYETPVHADGAGRQQLGTAPQFSSRIRRIINLYAWCSFDAGPTLCDWMERHAPESYRAMLVGDRASRERLGGHGNALAAPYHHIILPLASYREKVTEVRWGIADFRRRFQREPRGFWLPETAVDDETLAVLVQEGISFTVLAPHQVDWARTVTPQHDDAHMRPATVRWRAPNGQPLTIVPYDGALAGAVAFGSLLRDSSAFAQRLLAGARAGHDATVLATDGETFGHHHRGGDETLAAVIEQVAQRRDVRVHNLESLVASTPPVHDAVLHVPSAWSCGHGVDRWQRDCGCKLDPHAHSSQAWRAPLRRALAWLANEAHTVYALEAPPLFAEDIWRVRDAYGTVVGADGPALEQHVRHALRPALSDDDAALLRARTLLELQRATLRLFTSCAWFFDDVARIETVQVLRYAARVLALSGRQDQWEPTFLRYLSEAVSNDTAVGTAADLYRQIAAPYESFENRLAAAIAALAPAGALPAVLGRPYKLGAYDISVEERADRTQAYFIRLHHRRTGAITWHEALPMRGSDRGEVSVRAMDGRTLDVPTVFERADFPEWLVWPLLLPRAADDLFPGHDSLDGS